MKIIQLVNGYSKGDGVGNVIAAFDELLTRMGYIAEIHNKTLSFSDLDSADYSGENVVLYHVALSVDPLICYLKCRKIMVFHNITDPELLLGSGVKQMRELCSAGLYSIQGTAEYFERAIVFSQYSQLVLLKSGWEQSKINNIPIIVRLEKMSAEIDKDILERYKDDKVNILFTGRVFPNKKQESLIYTFKEYHEKYNKKSRLLIVGNHSNMAYFDALKRVVTELGLEEKVVFTGRVSLSEYVTYYQVADVFLCMSEHEGFCIPLVEAMHFDIPIIALNRTAIPDTLAGSGVLLKQKDFKEFAYEINKIMEDEKYRNGILEKQKNRMNELQPAILEKQYKQLLEEIINDTFITPRYKFFESSIVIGDRISVPDHLKDEINVVYGYGAAGNRLFEKLSEIGIKSIVICDANKGGISENGKVIEKPDETMKLYKEANYIISIQDKGIIKNVICMLRDNNIPQERIYVYDEINEKVI